MRGSSGAGDLPSAAAAEAFWRPGIDFIFASVGAAPHPPAGTFSPYSDGEKGAGRNAGSLPATLAIGETGDDGCPAERWVTE
jgi:hypothetical protein